MDAEDVLIYTEWIRLQDFLKFAGTVGTGGEAKVRIQAGEASVNGEPCTQRGRKLRPGDTVTFAGKAYRVTHGDCRTYTDYDGRMPGCYAGKPPFTE